VIYRLAAIDLDATLLGPALTLSERNGAALHRLAERGVVVAVATARWRHAALRPFDGLGRELAAIACAGADVRLAGGEVVRQDPLPAAFVPFLAELCERAGWEASLCLPDRVYGLAPQLPPWAASAPSHYVPVTSLAGTDLEGLLSVLAQAPPGDPHTGELLGWSESVATYRALTAAGGEILQVNAAGVDKGTGLLALCAALGVDPGEAVAFGDSEVDLPMFAAAGLRVAVANATPEVKARADLITGNAADDGVAEAIERIWA
jgi:hydroxymethylpyrimidine pyrophosphatase-like HAD family hydrolase